MGEMYDPARLQVCFTFQCHSRASPAVCDVEVLRLLRGSGRHPAIFQSDKGNRLLKHRQLPLRPTVFETQDVQIGVVAFDLEVAIVWSIPLIDDFDDFDLAPAEPKARRHFEPEMAGARLDLYLHGYPLPRRGRAIRIFLFDLCRVVPSCRLGARAVAVETTRCPSWRRSCRYPRQSNN